MLDCNSGSAAPAVKPKKRRRGNHSVACKNPNPKHERRVGYKKLPGAFGYVYRIAQKKNCSIHPYFSYVRRAMGRQRGFRPERANLINAFVCAVLDCLDIATGMTTKSIEQIALDLDVLPCRLSRLINEVFIRAGLMYVHADADKLVTQKDHNFGHVFDGVHGMWFPKMLVVTETFYRIAGADDRLIDRLNRQIEEHLQLGKHGLAKEGEVISQQEARNRRRARAWDISWKRRKQAATGQRTRGKLQQLNLDERQHFIAQKLLQQRPSYYENRPIQELEQDVWRALHDFGAATKPPDPARSH